jgi:thiol-disulfide isomerase/thioredoxin
MSSPKPEQTRTENDAKLPPDKLLMAIAIGLVAIFAFNYWYLAQSRNDLGYDFSVTTLSGETFSVGSNKGKIIVLNFMSTECPYCKSEIPELKRAWDDYGQKVVLVSISVDPIADTEDALRGFAKSYDANWIWARDVVGAAARYNIRGTPTTVILDKDGYEKYRNEGFTDAATFGKQIEELLNRT